MSKTMKLKTTRGWKHNNRNFMTSDEASKLKLGDRIKWVWGNEIFGTIIERSGDFLIVKWDHINTCDVFNILNHVGNLQRFTNESH